MKKQFRIKVIQQFDGQSEPFWGEAYDDEGRYVTGCRGITAEDVKLKLGMILDQIQKETIVYEGTYEA